VRASTSFGTARRRVVRSVAPLVAFALLGCQTARSFDHGCPGIYSGVRFYADQVGTVPFDGKIFFTLDLPLSAVFDTLLTPATAFVDRKTPPGGWVVGCRWAKTWGSLP
jgi:uncharacterized protein YceK